MIDFRAKLSEVVAGVGRAWRTVRGELSVLGAGGPVALAAAGDQAARMLVVAGQPLEEPVAHYGPFVMNTEDQIRQAIDDFEAGRL